MKKALLRVGDEVGIGAARDGVNARLQHAVIICLTAKSHKTYYGTTIDAETGGDDIVIATQHSYHVSENEFWQVEVISAQKVICPWVVAQAERTKYLKDNEEREQKYKLRQEKDKQLNDAINAKCLEKGIDFKIENNTIWAPPTKTYVDHTVLAKMLGIVID